MENAVLRIPFGKATYTFPCDAVAIADAIGNKIISFVAFVRSLENYLTDEDPEKRAHYSGIMAMVINNIAASELNNAEVEVLLDFLCCRLLDHPLVVQSSMQGLYFLISKCSLADGVPSKIVRTFSQNFTCQSQDKDVRFLYYKILHVLIHGYSKELKTLGPDFVYEFLSSIDGERDGEALLLLWSFVPTFLRTFNLGHLEEDAHEVFAAYFPVDYSDEKAQNAVKREDLANALIECLTASKSPQFVSLTMNLAFDKLSSALHVAKVDSLRLLGRSIDVFGFRAIQEHMRTIVNTMWNELMFSDNVDVRHHISAVIIRLRFAIKREPVPGITSTFNDYVWGIVEKHLVVESRFFDIALRFLKATSRKEDSTIYDKATAVLLKQRPLEARSKLTLLNALHSIKNAKFGCCIRSHLDLETASLGKPLAEICLEYLSNTECIDVKEKALVCIYCCITEMTEEQKRQLCYITSRYVIGENTLLRERSLKCMRLMQKKYEQEFATNLDSEFDAYPGPKPPRNEFMLGVLCALSVIPDYYRKFVDEACSFIKCWLLCHDGSWVFRYLRKFADYHITLENERDNGTEDRRDDLENFCDNETKESRDYLGNFLVDFWFDHCVQDNGEYSSSRWCDSALEDYACAILYCVSKMDDKQQIHLVGKYIDRFILFYENRQEVVLPKHFPVVIFGALFSGLKPLNQLTFWPNQIRDILRYCITCAIESNNEVYRTHAARLLAVIINKIPYEEFLNDLLEEVVWNTLLKTGIESQNLTMRQNAVAAIGYVIKGLYLADSKELEIWLNGLLTYVSTEGLDNHVSEAMKNILQEEEYFLTKICHCNVSNDFEKLFSVVPSLLSFITDTSSKPKCQSACLKIVALLYLKKIQSSSDSNLMKEIAFITAKHMDSQQPEDIVVPLLQVWHQLLLKKMMNIDAYVGELLQSFLDIAKHYKQMDVRCNALNCIYLFAQNYRCEAMPHAQMMVLGLGYCLSDKKRLVRKQAVQTRLAWYTLLHEEASKEE